MRGKPPTPKDLPYTMEEMASKKNLMKQVGKKAAAAKPKFQKKIDKSHIILGPRPKPGSKEALLPYQGPKRNSRYK
jgi:hypothetical protein